METERAHLPSGVPERRRRKGNLALLAQNSASSNKLSIEPYRRQPFATLVYTPTGNFRRSRQRGRRVMQQNGLDLPR